MIRSIQALFPGDDTPPRPPPQCSTSTTKGAPPSFAAQFGWGPNVVDADFRRRSAFSFLHSATFIVGPWRRVASGGQTERSCRVCHGATRTVMEPIGGPVSRRWILPCPGNCGWVLLGGGRPTPAYGSEDVLLQHILERTRWNSVTRRG